MRGVARFLCGVLAIAGFLPIGLGVFVRTQWAKDFATHETRGVIATLGIDARYELNLRLWPLSVTLSNIRVNASDGGEPVLTAKKATARPKIFGLMAGKLMINQIEVEAAGARAS